ncbi:MAG: hypothetical protein ACXVC1_06345 [Tumebacillaceae bacterium]
MTYTYQTKVGGLLLFGITALFLLYTIPQINLLIAGIGLKMWVVYLLVYLLAAGLLISKSFLLRSIRIDEKGLTVERRGRHALHFPWATLTVSERLGERRAPAGLVLERDGEEEPTWLPLNGLGDEQADALKQELRTRLGARYIAEELKSRGAGSM